MRSCMGEYKQSAYHEDTPIRGMRLIQPLEWKQFGFLFVRGELIPKDPDDESTSVQRGQSSRTAVGSKSGSKGGDAKTIAWHPDNEK